MFDPTYVRDLDGRADAISSAIGSTTTAIKSTEQTNVKKISRR